MSVLLFDDDKLKCDNHKHAAVKICVEKDCMAIPNMCCNSCMEYIHSGHQIIERSQFVFQSNKIYQQIQDQTNALEGQAKLFEQQGNNMKRIFNGELEKIRLQINRQIDLIRDKSNKLFDGIQLKAKKDIIKATTDARDSINKFKPKNLNNMSSEQIRQVVNLIWQKDYGLDRSKYKDFYGPLQQKIKEQLLELQVSCQEALESIQLEKEILQYVDTNYNKIDTEQEELTREELLVNERDAIKQQLEQHLAAKNCTCKGCNKVQKVKAYYGYYYNKSLYSTHHELPISKCAKAQKYSLRMHEVVNQLYEMKYRDNPIEDCVDAYFIY